MTTSEATSRTESTPAESTPAESTEGRTQPGCWPTLSYRDAEAALRYLVDVVGFTEVEVYRGTERRVDHAELAWPGGGGIMFGSDPGELDRWSGSTGGPGASTAYLSTDDIDGLAARVRTAGWEVLRPLADTHYGSREFAFLDPERNAWSVGTYRGAGS